MGKINQKSQDFLFKVSAILILIAVVTYYFIPYIARWIMIAGVAGYGALTFTSRYKGKNVRGKRLVNIQVFTAIIMIVSAYLMYIGRTEWVVLLLISAVLMVYTSFALSQVIKADKEENKKA